MTRSIARSSHVTLFIVAALLLAGIAFVTYRADGLDALPARDDVLAQRHGDARRDRRQAPGWRSAVSHQRSSISHQQSAISDQLLAQSCEHPLHLCSLVDERRVSGGGEQFQILREKQVVLELTG
jgi:hypothetical protein